MRIGEIAVAHIDFPCHFIHLLQVQSHQLLGVGLNLVIDFAVDLSQRRDAAVLVTLQQEPSEFCDEMRCVVAAGQHHTKIQIVQSILGSHSQFRSRARHLAGSPRSPHFYFLCVEAKRADRFENGNQVHHLGQACHFAFFMAAMRPNGFALLHVVDDPALGRNFGRKLAQGCQFLALVGVAPAGFLGFRLLPAWAEGVLRRVGMRPPGILQLVAALGLQKLIILIIEVAFALESRAFLLDGDGLAQNGRIFGICVFAGEGRQATGIHLHNILRNCYYIFLRLNQYSLRHTPVLLVPSCGCLIRNEDFWFIQYYFFGEKQGEYEGFDDKSLFWKSGAFTGSRVLIHQAAKRIHARETDELLFNATISTPTPIHKQSRSKRRMEVGKTSREATVGGAVGVQEWVWVDNKQLITINMDCEQPQVKMQEEEQIMIMMDGLYETEDDPDLLDLLGSEPQPTKKGSLNYDYQPASLPIPAEDIEGTEAGELKTSNRSTSTCADSQTPIRKCTCAKTRCQKNYCECFKLGESCTAHCECRDCGNKEKLFLSKPVAIKIKCKCLKSHCLKKYCECHSSGQRCGADCRCLECENVDVVKEEESYVNYFNYFEHHLFFNI